MKPKYLVLCPLKKEWQLTEKALQGQNIPYQRQQDRGRWYLWVPNWQAAICVGGHGKSQFALQTQFWIDFFQSIESVISIGGAGSLHPGLKVGTLFSVTEIIEHDYKEGFQSKADLPLFYTQNSEKTLDIPHLQKGRLASGDEDIVSTDRALQLAQSTDAVAVAWESARGIRTAQFNNLPYYEYRSITDMACEKASRDFTKNLPMGMERLVILLKSFFKI